MSLFFYLFYFFFPNFSLPYLLRLLQCLRQYEITKDHRQLWNAAKYFSSFPAIILSAMKSSADIGETPWVLGPDSIAYAW
jgi:hypothetical protein